MSTQNDPPRRRFLCVLAACAGSSVVGCSAPMVGPEAVGQVKAGVVSDYSVGSLRAVGNQPIAIGRDEGGFYAMTLTCTHAGCNMAQSGEVTPTRLTCFCHGAQFDGNGDVTRGPAEAPLAHFAVNIDADGAITIDGSNEVSADTRTPA